MNKEKPGTYNFAREYVNVQVLWAKPFGLASHYQYENDVMYK